MIEQLPENPKPEPAISSIKEEPCGDIWPELKSEVLYNIFATGDFNIFLDKKLDIDYKTKDSFTKTLSTPEVGKAICRSDVLQAIPMAKHSFDIQLSFRRLVGAGVARAFVGDHKNSAATFDVAESFIQARNQEIAWGWYLTACITTTAIIAIAAGLVWASRNQVVSRVGDDGFPVFLGLGSGAIGALFSVFQRAGKLKLDPAAGPMLHYLEGGCKILAGTITAFVVMLAIPAGLVGPRLVGTSLSTTNLATLMLLCLAAGTTERYANSIIKGISFTSKADSTTETDSK